jgi:hypothetical protein
MDVGERAYMGVAMRLQSAALCMAERQPLFRLAGPEGYLWRSRKKLVELWSGGRSRQM